MNKNLDTMREWAEIDVTGPDGYSWQFIHNSAPLLAEMIAKIDGLGLRDDYEERAAILEFDGGLSREIAERVAVVEVLNRQRPENIENANNV